MIRSENDMTAAEAGFPPEAFWTRVREGDLPAAVGMLPVHGVGEENMGDVLFSLARTALGNGWLGEARSLLLYLHDAVTDEQQAAPIKKLVGDICMLEGRHAEARRMYGAMPVTLGNISLCCSTFVAEGDAEGLLDLRDSVCSGLASAHRKEVENIINNAMRDLQERGGVGEAGHGSLLRDNLGLLARHATPAGVSLLDFAFQDSSPADVRVIGINGGKFVWAAGAWHRARRWQGDTDEESYSFWLPKAPNFITRCESLAVLIDLVESLREKGPFRVSYEALVLLSGKLLAAAAAVVDLSPIWSSGFIVHLMDEEDHQRDFQRLFVDEKVVFPDSFVDVTRKNSGFYHKVVNPSLQSFDEMLQRELYRDQAVVDEYYTRERPRLVVEKIRRGAPLRICMFTTRHSTFVRYSARDMARGFERLGHGVDFLIEPEGRGVGIRRDVLTRHFADNKPDIVFCLDHLRYEFPKIPKNMPFVSWIQDPMECVFGVRDADAVSRLDFIYLWSTLAKKRLEENPAFAKAHLELLNYPVDPDLYHPVDVEKIYDVCYVAHLNVDESFMQAYSAAPDVDLSEQARLTRRFVMFLDTLSLDELTYYLNHFYFYGAERYGAELLDIFFAYAGSRLFEPDKKAIEYWVGEVLYGAMRCRMLKPLVDAGVSLTLFGNGWERHPWFSRRAKGPVENGEPLNLVINQSKINLNISPGVSFHNKVPEVMGAGGFLLSRDIGEHDMMPLDDFFERGSETVLFADEQDLVDKVRYYLEHDDERQAIAARGREKMLRHTYDRAAAGIIEHIGKIA